MEDYSPDFTDDLDNVCVHNIAALGVDETVHLYFMGCCRPKFEVSESVKREVYCLVWLKCHR